MIFIENFRFGLYLFVMSAIFLGCGPESADEPTAACQRAADCAELLAPPCSGCPELAEAFCHASACVEKEEDRIDVVVDVMLPRGEATDLTKSLVYALATAESGEGAMGCDGAFGSGNDLNPNLNIFSAGFKNVSGGSFHQDLALGRCPEAPGLILVWGTEEVGGEGPITSTGCMAGDAADLASPDILITLQ